MGSAVSCTKERMWNWRQVNKDIPEKKNFLKMEWTKSTTNKKKRKKNGMEYSNCETTSKDKNTHTYNITRIR